MQTRTPGMLAAFLILLIAAGRPLTATAEDAGKERPSERVTLDGKARLLSAMLEQFGVSGDEELVARQVVLERDDGTVMPLLADVGARALFLDERLRDRPIRIKGRLLQGLPYVQVLSIQVEEDGGFHVPEYYCDVCTIRVRYPQICPCCQGPMELRMKPIAP